MLGTPSPRKLFIWLKLRERVGKKGEGGKWKTILTPLTASVLSSSLSRSKMCLCLLPALAFRIGIHRQRLTVGHLAPLQSLHKRRTEMRALAALRRGSEARSRRNPPFLLVLLSVPLPVMTSARAVSKYSKCTSPDLFEFTRFKRIILEIYNIPRLL